MRASVHIKIPNLTRGGSDEKAKAVLRPFGLSVRGMGGEHTPIGVAPVYLSDWLLKHALPVSQKAQKDN